MRNVTIKFITYLENVMFYIGDKFNNKVYVNQFIWIL